ncbi:MAG: T9SS type A sorting domain-containing protein, partial [Bacteroidota bacterium]
FAVKAQEHVTVKVFNLIGQEVATLFNDAAEPNQIYTMKFDGTKLSSGLYVYTLRSGSRNETRKMLLTK